MWTQEQLVEDLTDIGLPSGSAALVHASIDAIGPIQGGAETLVAALCEVLGSAGTLLVPTFDLQAEPTVLPWQEQPASKHPTGVASAAFQTSALGKAVLQHPDAFRSDHPMLSFAALGADAEALTSHVPFHYPLGSGGPLARLHQRNGWILLIGVGHTGNMSLHLAEIWANVPYIHRPARWKGEDGNETTMMGSPDCTAGFPKIEPLLRQSRILHRGYIGNAESQLMRQQQTVSMAIAMLQGSPSALLCEDEECRACNFARRMTSDQIVEPI